MSRREAYSRADMQRLAEMVREGKSPRDIAETLNRSEDSVRVKISRIRRLFGDLPYGYSRERKLTVRIQGIAMHALSVYADAHGVQTDVLACELLTVIAKDDLFKAVLGEDA